LRDRRARNVVTFGRPACDAEPRLRWPIAVEDRGEVILKRFPAVPGKARISARIVEMLCRPDRTAYGRQRPADAQQHLAPADARRRAGASVKLVAHRGFSQSLRPSRSSPDRDVAAGRSDAAVAPPTYRPLWKMISYSPPKSAISVSPPSVAFFSTILPCFGTYSAYFSNTLASST